MFWVRETLETKRPPLPSSLTSAPDPWSSEFSGSFVTLQLVPGQSRFDWGESLDPGLDSEEFLRPLVNPTPAEKKVGGLCVVLTIQNCFAQTTGVAHVSF